MAFIGSITDHELARRSAGSALAGQNILGVPASALSSVLAARATARVANVSICDQLWIRPVVRGYAVASNLGGVFSSDYSLLFGSLPNSVNHIRMMINGG